MVVRVGTSGGFPYGTVALTARPSEELERMVMLKVYFLVLVLAGKL